MVVELEYFPEFGEPTWQRKETEEKQVADRDSRHTERYIPTGIESPRYHRTGLRDD